ncbi:hypothetical protein Q5752_001253 [Cryptotrichosporon argae]
MSFVRLTPSPTPSLSSIETVASESAPALPTAGLSRPALGLRDLAGIYRRERRARKSEADTAPAGSATGPTPGRVTIEVVALPPDYDEAVATPRQVCGTVTGAQDREAWDPGVTLFRSPAGDPTFARDVEIRGWKVVGGKSWTGGGKVGAYVVYDIVFNLQQGGQVAVLRRYTDFERLTEDLKRAYPHLRQAIPLLPGKNHMSKFSPAFLADRQTRLQRFVRTVALHPEMGRGGDSVVGRWVLAGMTG